MSVSSECLFAIQEMERVRDQNFRAMYGAWDVIKNVEKRYPAHRLNWVAYVAGKRESRRLLGDVILTGEHLRDGVRFPDASASKGVSAQPRARLRRAEIGAAL